MRFAVVGPKEDPAALAKRLYAEKKAGALAGAAKALRDANPALGAAGAPGAIVVVPDVPGAAPTAEARSVADVAQGVLARLEGLLEPIRRVLDEAADRMEEEAKTTIERAGDRDVSGVLMSDPALRKAASEAVRAAEVRTERAKVLREIHQRIADQMRADVVGLASKKNP